LNSYISSVIVFSKTLSLFFDDCLNSSYSDFNELIWFDNIFSSLLCKEKNSIFYSSKTFFIIESFLFNCWIINSLQCSIVLVKPFLESSTSFKILLNILSVCLWDLAIVSNMSFLTLSCFSLMVWSCLLILVFIFSILVAEDFIKTLCSSKLTLVCFSFTINLSIVSLQCSKRKASSLIVLLVLERPSLLLAMILDCNC